MGHRLHTATKYEVKYAVNGRFNWASGHINPIIICLAEGDFWASDLDCYEAADTIEANRHNLLNNLDKIINPNPEWEYQEELDELIGYMENDKECNVDRQYLYDELKVLIEQSDPNCTNVHFAWF
jgi:hypothetical protein